MWYENTSSLWYWIGLGIVLALLLPVAVPAYITGKVVQALMYVSTKITRVASHQLGERDGGG